MRSQMKKRTVLSRRKALIGRLGNLAKTMGRLHEQMVNDEDFHLADMVAVGAVEAVAQAAVVILKTPEAVP